MKNWERYKLKAKEAEFYIRRGGRYIAGPFGTALPPALHRSHRGRWYYGDGIAGVRPNDNTEAGR
jgi:hypothetical protein